MNISIKIISKKMVRCEGKHALIGLIHIGEFEETICVHLNPWTKKDYETQWHEGLERLKTYDTSCFVVNVSNPEDSSVVEWWLLYRIGNIVFVQNGNLSKNSYKKLVGQSPFTPETCYSFIPLRKTHTRDGHKISEWSVSYD